MVRSAAEIDLYQSAEFQLRPLGNSQIVAGSGGATILHTLRGSQQPYKRSYYPYQVINISHILTKSVTLLSGSATLNLGSVAQAPYNSDSLLTDIGQAGTYLQDGGTLSTIESILNNVPTDIGQAGDYLKEGGSLGSITNQLLTDIGQAGDYLKDGGSLGSITNKILTDIGVAGTYLQEGGSVYSAITGQSRSGLTQQTSSGGDIASNASINHYYAPSDSDHYLEISAVMQLAYVEPISTNVTNARFNTSIISDESNGWSVNLYEFDVGNTTSVTFSMEQFISELTNINVAFTANNNIYWSNRKSVDYQQNKVTGAKIRIEPNFKFNSALINNSADTEFALLVTSVIGKEIPL